MEGNFFQHERASGQKERKIHVDPARKGEALTGICSPFSLYCLDKKRVETDAENPATSH